METLIASVASGVPATLTEIITLGRILKKRAVDILAYFNRPGTSNGPTEAITGRLERLRGSALGFLGPHQLHHTITTRDRRVQTTTTPWISMSPIQEWCERSLWVFVVVPEGFGDVVPAREW
jgi:Transposase